jgi:cell division protein FtsB
MSKLHLRPIIVSQRPRRLRLVALLVLAWVCSLAATWRLASYLPQQEGFVDPAIAAAVEEAARLRQKNEALTQEVTTLDRSRQVERTAAQAVQATLAERDQEIAALRNDVAFYERLVGSSAQRMSLTVHSVKLEPSGKHGWQYAVTLTQTLKKASMTRGTLAMQIEGLRNGKPETVDWDELGPQGGAPVPFSFKYFQQIEGSLVLPEGFVPHRLKVRLDSDAGKVEKVFPWQESQTQGVG